MPVVAAVDVIVGGRFGEVTVKPAGSRAVCVLVTTLTARGPSAVVADMRHGRDERRRRRAPAVEPTVIPAPKVGVVRPATNWTFEEPVIRTATCWAPRAALFISGSVIVMICSVRPPATLVVVRLRTRTAAGPMGNPAGTVTPMRREACCRIERGDCFADEVDGGAALGRERDGVVRRHRIEAGARDLNRDPCRRAERRDGGERDRGADASLEARGEGMRNRNRQNEQRAIDERRLEQVVCSDRPRTADRSSSRHGQRAGTWFERFRRSRRSGEGQESDAQDAERGRFGH